MRAKVAVVLDSIRPYVAAFMLPLLENNVVREPMVVRVPMTVTLIHFVRKIAGAIAMVDCDEDWWRRRWRCRWWDERRGQGRRRCCWWLARRWRRRRRWQRGTWGCRRHRRGSRSLVYNVLPVGTSPEYVAQGSVHQAPSHNGLILLRGGSVLHVQLPEDNAVSATSNTDKLQRLANYAVPDRMVAHRRANPQSVQHHGLHQCGRYRVVC